MTSTKPYLLRAFYEWIVDNAQTPYLLVRTNNDGEQVMLIPQHLKKDPQIVFNISPIATEKLDMSNSMIEFRARFSGTPQDIVIPIEKILGLYARENGKGVFFEEDKNKQISSPVGAATNQQIKSISVDSQSANLKPTSNKRSSGKAIKKKLDKSFLKVVK